MEKRRRSAGGFHSVRYVLGKWGERGFVRSLKDMVAPNTCKTCALGMGGQKGGMTNELGHFPEFCKKSVQANHADSLSPISNRFFEKHSVNDLKKLSARELELSGRLMSPLYRKKGDSHYKPISWEQSYQVIVQKMKTTRPERSFFYASGRSSNEAGWIYQLLARSYGSPHIHNCSYYCHQATGVGLGSTLGTKTATVSLDDVHKADLVFVIGANPSSNHPRFLSTLRRVKQNGGKVVIVNPVHEPGLEKFRIPSALGSLLFGTKLANEYVMPNSGGDQALFMGIAKVLIEKKRFDKYFVDHYTEGFESYCEVLNKTTYEEIVETSGVELSMIRHLATLIFNSSKVIFSWAMGLTHHHHGVDTVQSLVNLALTSGMINGEGKGLLPLRGHSNVQGMGTMGVTPKLGAELLSYFEKEKIIHKLDTSTGEHTMGCMHKAMNDEIDLAFLLGGNLYASNPDLQRAKVALEKIGLIVHFNTSLNLGHTEVEASENLILPVLVRDEESQITTQESMFNFVRASSGGRERFFGARSEGRILLDIAKGYFEKGHPVSWDSLTDYDYVRSLIADSLPHMEKIRHIGKSKEEFTIHNRVVHKPKFATHNKKANFMAVPLKTIKREVGVLHLMTVRSEGQFNSVIFEENDHFRGVDSRDVILMNQVDMDDLSLDKDDLVTVISTVGEMKNIKVVPYYIKKGHCLMYYPEANVLIPQSVDPKSFTPSFKLIPVKIETGRY
jgi:molybdopterin-dependent oxidoreductase alpha subunit